jgi:hypothetical protein
VREPECRALLQDFFAEQRRKQRLEVERPKPDEIPPTADP